MPCPDSFILLLNTAALLLLLSLPPHGCLGFTAAPAIIGTTTKPGHAAAAAAAARSSDIRVFALPREGIMQVSRTYTVAPKTINEDDYKDVTQWFNIAYKIYRPMTMSSQQAAPIVVLHGGPGLPSNYLQPLVDVVPYRSIVFYDQLGCGKSDHPDNIQCYSIEQSVDDLEELIQKLGIRQFHLFGHSFGGILGYEFLKRRAERSEKDHDYKVLSFIASSAPTSIPQVEAQIQELLQNMLAQNDDETTVEERFQKQYICRTDEEPMALIDAYAHAGTIWKGSNVIADYQAEPPSDNAGPLPPAMIMRGQHDFVSQICSQNWNDNLWNHERIREKVLDGCSHHGLLENGYLYGDMIDSFCTEYDS